MNEDDYSEMQEVLTPQNNSNEFGQDFEQPSNPPPPPLQQETVPTIMSNEDEDGSNIPVKENEKINISIMNSHGNQVFFKVKGKTRLKKVFDAYCNRSGLISSSIRFSFDGERMNPDFTAVDYEMTEGAQIDAMVEQTGGWPDMMKIDQ